MPPALARLLAALGASEPYSPSPSSQLRAIVERCPELSPTLPAIDAVDDADAAGLFVAAQPVLVAVAATAARRARAEAVAATADLALAVADDAGDARAAAGALVARAFDDPHAEVCVTGAVSRARPENARNKGASLNANRSLHSPVRRCGARR